MLRHSLLRRSIGSIRQSSSRVRVSIDADGIAEVVLHRPEKLNALDLPMFEAIRDAAQQLQTNDSVRVVILRGEGRAFCAGLDVKSIFSTLPPPIDRLMEPYSTTHSSLLRNLAQDPALRWRELPFPVLCCVHGACFGGGLQIALGADLRLATPDAQLSVMEVKWGLIPDMTASVTLRELVSIDVAKELTWTGRIVSGEEAQKLGLVTRVVDDPVEEARKVANEIVEKSPDAIARAKELFHETWSSASVDECLETERKLQTKLLVRWNQLAASGRNFGLPLPYTAASKDKK